MFSHFAFNDIMNVIKKSIHICKTFKSLQFEKYQILNNRMISIITFDQDRVKVFQIFERYEKFKFENRELNIVDWTINLLRVFRNKSHIKLFLAFCVDEIYVNEIQNQRCIDIALMLKLIQNSRKFHFDENIAQDISQNSIFRFQDAKTLFHDHFVRQSTNVKQQSLIQSQLFTLNRNYRSHQEILFMTSIVMKILWQTFSHIVDKLNLEIDTLIKSTSILFFNCDASILTRRNVETSISFEHELLFDVEQVVLVRDDIMKVELLKQIEKIALILIILQVKSMKFDDVILWNFFFNIFNKSFYNIIFLLYLS